jgi:hypothetical protein
MEARRAAGAGWRSAVRQSCLRQKRSIALFPCVVVEKKFSDPYFSWLRNETNSWEGFPSSSVEICATTFIATAIAREFHTSPQILLGHMCLRCQVAYYLQNP